MQRKELAEVKSRRSSSVQAAGDPSITESASVTVVLTMMFEYLAVNITCLSEIWTVIVLGTFDFLYRLALFTPGHSHIESDIPVIKGG